LPQSRRTAASGLRPWLWSGALDRIVSWIVKTRPIKWLESHSRWSELRALGQSGLVRASVLMPAFGYILLLSEDFQRYLTIKHQGWLLHCLPSWVLQHLPSWLLYPPSLWRVWMLYYGTFFLALGSLFFSRYCPVESKRYASDFAMVDAEREHHHHSSQQEELQRRLRELYKGMSKWEASIFPYMLKLDEPALGVQWSDNLGGMLIYRWRLADIKRPALRIVVMLLFGFGLALLAVPAIFTFFQVTLAGFGLTCG
jgi:hypothetical protein